MGTHRRKCQRTQICKGQSVRDSSHMDAWDSARIIPQTTVLVWNDRFDTLDR